MERDRAFMIESCILLLIKDINIMPNKCVVGLINERVIKFMKSRSLSETPESFAA